MGDLMHAYKKGAEYAIFDMARWNDNAYWPWGFMENLKSGWFTATKYNGRFAHFRRPKVIVFTNQMPDMSKFSADRYEIHVLED